MNEDFKDFIEASGLLSYDPDTISKIYQKNPNRLFKRLWQTLIPIFAYIFSIGCDKITGMISRRVDKACPALTNAGPSSTNKSVNSFALNLAFASFFNLPVNLSHVTEKILRDF